MKNDLNPFTLGNGRFAGFASLTIGILSILSVLCLRYPHYLTTPELRVHYDMRFLRLVLALAMAAGVVLGLGTFILRRQKHLGALGICSVLLALFLGGPYVPYQDFDNPQAYLGLDWLVLDLFFTGTAFIALERLFPKVVPEQPVLRPDWQLDLGYFTVNHLAIGAFLLISTHFAHDFFGWAVWKPVQGVVLSLPGWARFLLVILAADAMEYATHRAYHEIPFLWRFHAVHHSPQHMDWLSGSRLHVLEVIATRSSILVPVFLLGFPQDTIFAYVIFVSIQGVMIHSNIKVDLGWLHYLIVTPQFHHWHHGSEPEALDRNYCAHTPLWDLVFRTYHQPNDRWPEAYGTVKPIPGGFVGQFLFPFRGVE